MDNVVPVWGMEEDLQQELGRQRMEGRDLGRQRMECMELARQIRMEQESEEEDYCSMEGT